MTKLLIRFSEKKHKNNPRSGYAMLSGTVGIVCNLLLCAVKFAVGALTGSVAVTADAVNNLSDSASNIVTLTGTRLSDKHEDREHPFGHGRMEYVAALIVAVSVFVVSFELAKTSVERILHPEELRYSLGYVLLLSGTVLVKLWMAYFNHRLYRLSGNVNLKAVRQDSINDCLATGATILSLVLGKLLQLTRIDGIIGIGVSVFIFYAGIGILRDVISPLLGEAPPKELTERIEAIITESDRVLGVHDLVIHYYGANKILASADAEVDASANIFTLHEIIDAAEKRVAEELNIDICIHMDPVDKTDTLTERYKLLIRGIIGEYDAAFSFHDFRMTEQEGQKTLCFELVIPLEETDDSRIRQDLQERFKALCPEIKADFTIEHSYV